MEKPSTKNEWNPFTTFKYAALIVVSTGLCMIVGSSSFIQTNFRFFLQLKSNISYFSFDDESVQTYRILWYAPPDWVKNRTTTRTEYCEYRNCEITFNKSEIERSDLVIFHHNNMNIEPPNRIENQKWVFACWEAPAHAYGHYRAKHWRDKFDWTMTYRTNSEGFAPYGTIIRNKFLKTRNYSTIYSKKTKSIAWVVSHCRARSKRDEYVAEMNKTIRIDVFGRCGKPCPTDCFKHISEKYMFYLSFENSLCSDYITEKLFRIYNEDFDLIPVVRGAPNVKQLLPNKTFISTLDYSSPGKLAQYLKNVGANKTKYLAMLKSKHEYINTMNIYQNGMCSLCKKLNKKFKRRKTLSVLEAMSSKQCFDP